MRKPSGEQPLAQVISNLQRQEVSKSRQLQQRISENLASLQPIKIEHQRLLSSLEHQLNDLARRMPEIVAMFERGVNWVQPTLLVYEPKQSIAWRDPSRGLTYPGKFKYELKARAANPDKTNALQRLLGTRRPLQISLSGEAHVYNDDSDYRSPLSGGASLGELAVEWENAGEEAEIIAYLHKSQFEALEEVKKLEQDHNKLGQIIFGLM